MVDLEKYSGLWYEVYRQNAPFEIICKIPPFGEPSNVTATYKYKEPSDKYPYGSLDVVNTCRSVIGVKTSVSGVAYPTSETSDSFPVSLNLNFFGRNNLYTIFYTDYDLSIVGNLDNNFLSFLSRTSTIPQEMFGFLVDISEINGFTVEI